NCYYENIKNRVVLDRVDFLKNEVKYSHFFHKNTNIFMMLNSSESQHVQSNIRVPGDKNLYLVNLCLGELHSFSKAKKNGDFFEFTHQFGPTESYLFATSNKRLPNVKNKLVNTVINYNKNYRILFKNSWKFRPENLNVLPLTNWSYKLNYNRDVNPGLNYSYETFIEVEQVPEKSLLLLHDLFNQAVNGEGGGMYPIEISVNGFKLKTIDTFIRGEEEFKQNERIETVNYLGRSVLGANVANIIKKGYNRILIKTMGSLFNPLQITYPVLFVGDFSCNKGGRGWVIGKRKVDIGYGSWTEHGYPFYNGSGVYEQEFEKPGNFSSLILKLGRVEEIAWVTLNNQPIDVLPWAPSEADITPFINEGKNIIGIRVANSHTNIFKMINYPAGLVSEVCLDVY
ncbi:MAG: hypothetical protein ABIA63_00360, partial [bacterium]